MERKPEVRPWKHRVYDYSGPVIQLRITGLFHSTKNDISFLFSANCRNDQHRCASVCWQAPLFIFREYPLSRWRIRCRSPPSILVFQFNQKKTDELSTKISRTDLSIYPSSEDTDGMDGSDLVKVYRKIIRDNMEYECLVS